MKNKLFTLVFAWFFTLAMLAPGVQVHAQGFDYKTRQAVASDFNGWRAYSISSTSLASGAGKVITIEDPRVTIQGFGQINPFVANSTFTIDTGSVQETVTATAVSCSQPTACSFTATLSNAHSGRFPIVSGSGGAQEALDYLTNNGGQGALIIQPFFAPATSVITGLARGSTAIGVEDWRSGNVNYYGWTGSAYASVFNIGATNASFNTTAQVSGITQYYEATADTSTAGATFTPITGLTWTIPANTVIKYPFHCVLTWSEATAATANAFGINTATQAPTNGALNGLSTTAATTVVRASVTGYNATGATTIVTVTPTANGTTEQVILDGFVEQPTNAANAIVQIGVATVSGGTDITTVKRGSYCRLF